MRASRAPRSEARLRCGPTPMLGYQLHCLIFSQVRSGLSLLLPSARSSALSPPSPVRRPLLATKDTSLISCHTCHIVSHHTVVACHLNTRVLHRSKELFCKGMTRRRITSLPQVETSL